MKTILAFDIDGTLLERGETFDDSGCPRRILQILLAILRKRRDAAICFITGNDYEGLQKRRIVEPLLQQVSEHEILARIIIYADGATRKFVFQPDAHEFVEDSSYREGPPRTYFTEDEGATIQQTISEELSKLKHKYRGDPLRLEWPNISYHFVPVDPVDSIGANDLHISLFPINVNPSTSSQPDIGIKLASEFCNPTNAKVRQVFTQDLKILPDIHLHESSATIEIIVSHFSDPRLRFRQAELADIIMKLYELFNEYPLSSPTYQLRGSNLSDGSFLLTQLAIKPIKSEDLREELIGAMAKRSINAVSMRGGKTSVDVQRTEDFAGGKWIANKTCAIKDALEIFPGCTIRYFGDEFYQGGNDLWIAVFAETQGGKIRCFNVGKRGVACEHLFESGGGPAGALSHLAFMYL